MAFSSSGERGGPEILVCNGVERNLWKKIKEHLTEEEFIALKRSYKKFNETQYKKFLDTAGYLGGVWVVKREIGSPEIITSWFRKETGWYLT